MQQTCRYLFSICGVCDLPQKGFVAEAASSGLRQAHCGLSIFVKVDKQWQILSHCPASHRVLVVSVQVRLFIDAASLYFQHAME
eukprot:3045923-Amphidinium_carterae.1